MLLPAEYVREHVRLGYAVTIHDSQGATADHAIVVTPVKNLDSELAYVAASRARHTTTMLVLTDPDPGWKDLKSRLRLEGAEQTASKHIETMRTRARPGLDAEHAGRGVDVPQRKADAPATPTRRPVSKEPDGRPNGTTRSASVTSEARSVATWPVSKHRAALSALHSRLEEAKETHAQVMQDAIEKAALIRDSTNRSSRSRQPHSTTLGAPSADIEKTLKPAKPSDRNRSTGSRCAARSYPPHRTPRRSRRVRHLPATTPGSAQRDHQGRGGG